MHKEAETYQRQGFGMALDVCPPYGLLIVDFVNGFADPAIFGGGNIAAAIETTKGLLAHARQQQWTIAHTRIVFADDGADHNIFSLKVPGMLTLKENAPASAIVPDLAPVPGELVVRKQVPSAFFGTGLGSWLTQRGVQTLVVAGPSPAAACAPALSTPCRSGFAHLSCPIASEIARLAHTTPTCSIWNKNMRRLRRYAKHSVRQDKARDNGLCRNSNPISSMTRSARSRKRVTQIEAVQFRSILDFL